MELKTIDLSAERKLLTNLIVSDEFCKRIVPIFNPIYCKSKYAQIISEWIVEFYNVYKKAPNKTIEDIYKEKVNVIQDDIADLIADFLQNISDEYIQTVENIEYDITQAEQYISARSMEVMIENVKRSLQKNDLLQAEKFIAEYKKPATVSDSGVDILNDAALVSDAFNEEDEILFKFPGALGELAGEFHRGDFVSFFGPQKRGKSQMLWYSAEAAMYKELKVVFFTMEMTRKQMIRRGWRSIVGQTKEPMTVKFPYFVQNEATLKYGIAYKKLHKTGVNVTKIEYQQSKLRKMLRNGSVRILSIPAYRSTVEDIENHLDVLQLYSSYTPDVVVIDYADLLIPSRYKGTEYRHQLDDIWKGLRRISQERNILVITASQTNKATFDRDVRKNDSAEDSRKIGHITCGLGLNQKDSEIEKGILRINQLVVREEKATTEQVIVLECLDICKPVLDSKFVHEINLDYEIHENKRRKRRTIDTEE